MALALQSARTVSARRAVNADETSPGERPLDDDDLLLARIATGDQGAFRLLVERHLDRAYALALRILRNASDAEDVVQDVMLKVWSVRGTWQTGRARFSTWLYRVVTNRCLDLHRRPRTEAIDTAPESADGAPTAVDTIQSGEVSSLLDRAMARLPEQQRIALILSYTDDLRNAEIAEIMDTTVMAVESLLKRGRQQLRQILAGAEGDIRASFTND